MRSEEDRVKVPVAAVMRHLEDIHVHLAAFLQQAHQFQSLQDLVAPGVTREQHPLVADLSEHHDARQVGNRRVGE